LTPRAYPRHFDGNLSVTNIRVINASMLTELLNAISVVGLLDQLNGEGLLFGKAEGRFVLTPDIVQIQQGSAVGASLGVSMAGNLQSDTGKLALQGVISPIYLLNGLGQMFSRKGEGLFGFNYSMLGDIENPDISVNPLSIFTPGLFRELFRASPPNVAGNAP
jgi:hypothetical protein